MIFTTPALLLALILLPVLWWLLRATPPAPRAQRFPAIRLLALVRPKEETPARTPWWLLLLRLAAAGLIIAGLAGPVLNAGPAALPASGPALLVIDDGFAAAADFTRRLDAAQSVLDRLERAGRRVSLLTTAPGLDGAAPASGPIASAAVLRAEVQALRPKPWPVDREAAARAVRGSGPVYYIGDGLKTAGDDKFDQALAARGPVTELRGELPVRLLSAVIAPDRLSARLRLTPAPQRTESVLAEANDERVFARIPLPVPAGARDASVDLPLPPELRNQLGALRLSGVSGAGAVVLLDEAARRRPVGLLTEGSGGETPLLGDLFFIDKALSPTTELRRGDIKALLSRPLSMLVIAGGGLASEDAARVEEFVRKGGLLLRFAGPELAPEAQPGEADPLLPERLLAGDRELGGAMSWSQPAHVAPFAGDSPFAGLRVSPEVAVNREVLADPSDASQAHVWARLTDGTPLVTMSRLGAGEVVLFHVTANADWSNLPLSGLFVEMLNRLVERSVGVAAADEARALAPALALDGEGTLGAPPAAAQPMTVADMATSVPSPLHPPGFYGPERDRHAFNLGSAALVLDPMAPVPGAAELTLASAPRERKLGPDCVGLALLLLALDMVVTLRLRGLLDRIWRPAAAAMLAVGVGLCSLARAESPALATHLAYVMTGDAEVDAVSRAGLAGLTDYVNSRTAAVLADPLPVMPGKDDLSFYPFLYFPVTADAGASPGAVAALNDYMHHGGIIIFDLRGGGADTGGSGAGFAPDNGTALQLLGRGLEIPRLAPLTSTHVLAHAFYLLSDFPGRFDGDTVWVQQAQDRSNDSVSPVIVGSNDWAAAWAEDEDGKPEFAVIPGGQRQRTLAFRFGVNLVMYALTGNYKGDQVHVPAILERLGQ